MSASQRKRWSVDEVVALVRRKHPEPIRVSW